MDKNELLKYNKQLRVENAFLRAKAISAETVEDERKKLKVRIASLTQDSYSTRTQDIHDCFGITFLIGLLLIVAGSVINLWEIIP